MAALPDGDVRHGLPRPAVQHRRRAPPRRARLRRRLRGLRRVPRAAPAPHARAARAARHAVPAPRLPRGAPGEDHARRDLRPGVLPQRAHLDLRLRRAAEAPLAGEARHDPRLRPRPRAVPLRRRRGRPRAVHGAGPRRAGEGRPRQAPERLLVAHDRPDELLREDRLPDAEAGGDRAADGRRVVAARRLVPGPVRGLGHARRGVPAARPAVRPHRAEPGGGRGDARTRFRTTGGEAA